MAENYNIDWSGKIQVGTYLSVGVHPTLRIPDDPKDTRRYQLPQGFGTKPLYPLNQHRSALPPEWASKDGLLMPVYVKEGVFLSFEGQRTKPQLVKVGVGGINVISGKPMSDELSDEQDYVVVPGQDYLDGIKTGSGEVRQFVIVPHGLGDTVEGQVTGKEEQGGFELRVFSPPHEWFAGGPYGSMNDFLAGLNDKLGGYGGAYGDGFDSFGGGGVTMSYRGGSPRGAATPKAAQMGVGAGGRMRQKIAPLP